MNNKGFAIGYGVIAGFFVFLIAFAFMVVMADFIDVEIGDPLQERLHNMTLDVVGGDNTSVYVLKQQELHQDIDAITLPWNLTLIIATFMIVAGSMVMAMRTEKQGMASFMFHTIAGLMFLIYVIHLFLLAVIDYFQVQFIYQIFGDLLETTVPFYNVLIENWWWVIIWGLALQVINKEFGREPQDTNLGRFGQ